jgi:predicted N-acetyltransferase YhbS
MKTIIRNETPADYRSVETLTREAFWNQNGPGCEEHYFVNQMRNHPDFLPELAFVLELDGQLIGNVMYTKSWLVDEQGNRKTILSFGPVSIHPDYQRKGYGKQLLEHSFAAARELGYDVIVIFGDPGNYVARGFQSCKKHNVCLEGDRFPTALLVKELTPGALSGKHWRYLPSSAEDCCSDQQAVDAFDAAFPPKEKGWQPSQEAFYIHSHSMIVC